MRIQKFNYQLPQQKKSSQTPKSFTSLLRVGYNGLPIDSGFYRDPGVLKKTAKILNEYFPKGSLVIDAACSDGEESWSLFTLLGNSQHKILGVDYNPDAIQLAKRKIFSVFSNHFDSFLIKPKSELTPENAELQDLFNKYFVKTRKPSKEINNNDNYWLQKMFNSDFKEQYFKIKPEYSNGVQFLVEDINEINNIETNGQQVGAVLFRNAVYHLCENSLIEHLKGSVDLTNHYFNKQAYCDDLVDKIHQRLALKGVFDLGEHAKDHFYIADKYTDSSNLMPLKRLSLSQDTIDRNIDIQRLKTTLMCKRSPMLIALERDGRFKPIYYSQVEFLDNVYKKPTVWQKVK